MAPITACKFLIFSLLIAGFGFAKSIPPYLNPTGTYKLVSKVKVKNGDTYGYFGSIQVKAISKTKIVLVLGVNKGAPSYNSGSLADTLTFTNNTSTFNGDTTDPTCKITFAFTAQGIRVKQKQADLNFGCGFGHGVFADGFYKKLSGKIPILKDPDTDQLIK